jgi:tetratricopeptide (TPR) repeat protein
MSRLLEIQLRHSSHYLTLLRGLGEQFTEGREALKNALTQYESEAGNIDAGFDSAERHAGKNGQAARLCTEYANAAPHLLNFRQQPRERLRWLKVALATADTIDSRIRARLLLGVGINHSRLAENASAITALEEALRICRDVGDRDTEAEVLSYLGITYIVAGQTDNAIVVLEQSLSIARNVKNPRTECIALNSLGQAQHIRREFQKAIDYYEASLYVANERGFLPEEGLVLTNLGRTYAIIGRPLRAIEIQQQSLRIAREIGDKRSEMSALTRLGLAQYVMGEYKSAITLLNSALPLARRLGDELAQVEILTILGDSHLNSEQVDLAVDSYKQRILIKRSLPHDPIYAIEHILMTEALHENGLEIESSQVPGIGYR